MFTEKFALLNLLKAIESLSTLSGQTDNAKKSDPPTAEPQPDTRQNTPPAQHNNTYPNVMASVLERHEQVSNRIKNRR